MILVLLIFPIFQGLNLRGATFLFIHFLPILNQKTGGCSFYKYINRTCRATPGGFKPEVDVEGRRLLLSPLPTDCNCTRSSNLFNFCRDTLKPNRTAVYSYSEVDIVRGVL